MCELLSPFLMIMNKSVTKSLVMFPTISKHCQLIGLMYSTIKVFADAEFFFLNFRKKGTENVESIHLFLIPS